MGLFDNFLKKLIREQNEIIGEKNSLVTYENVTKDYLSYLNEYIVFDIETTGLNRTNDRIIEIGAVLYQNGQISNKYGTLIHSVNHIPKSASRVNHITDEMLLNAPSEEQAYLEIIDFMKNAISGDVPLVAHNASFDISFLKNTLERLEYNGNLKYIDTLTLSKKKLDLCNYKQQTVADFFGIDNKNAHRALDDAETCGMIFAKLLKANDKQSLTKKCDYENEITNTFEIGGCTVTTRLKGDDTRTLTERYGADTVKSWYKKVENPSDEIMAFCAVVQKIIKEAGFDTKNIRFSQHQSIVRCNIYLNFFAFKYGGRLSYMIVDKKFTKNKDIKFEDCTNSDLTHVDSLCNDCNDEFVRIKLTNPKDMELFSDYILYTFKKGYKWLDETRKFLGEDFDIYLAHNTNIDDSKLDFYIDLFDKHTSEKEAQKKLLELKKEKLMKKSVSECSEVKTIQPFKQKKEEQKENKRAEKKRNSKRKLRQYDDEGNLLAEYNMLKDAIDKTGINSKSIRDAANGKQKHAGGFVWRYITFDDEGNEIS